MTTASPKRAVPRVAVGATRELAARSFGQAHDDLLVTSFADFEAEVDLAGVEAVEVVAGEGMVSTVQSVVAAQRAGRELDLRTTVPREDTDGFLAVLRQLDLQITVVESTGREPVLGLAPRGSSATGPEELVLQALRAGPPDDVVVPPRQAGGDVTAAATDQATPTAPKGSSRPVPRLVEVLGSAHRVRDGRRRLAVALAAALVAVLALVGLGLLADAVGATLSVVLPVVVALVALATGASSYVTLLLARQVNVQTGRVERAVLRNRKVVQKRALSLERRTAALERRIATLEQGQARFPFALEYLEALGELGAQTSGHVRDLTETLTQARRSS